MQAAFGIADAGDLCLIVFLARTHYPDARTFNGFSHTICFFAHDAHVTTRPFDLLSDDFHVLRFEYANRYGDKAITVVTCERIFGLGAFVGYVRRHRLTVRVILKCGCGRTKVACVFLEFIMPRRNTSPEEGSLGKFDFFKVQFVRQG